MKKRDFAIKVTFSCFVYRMFAEQSPRGAGWVGLDKVEQTNMVNESSAKIQEKDKTPSI